MCIFINCAKFSSYNDNRIMLIFVKMSPASELYFLFESYFIADYVNEYKMILSITKGFFPWSKNLSHPNQSTYLENQDCLPVKPSQSSLKPTLMIHEQMNMRSDPRELIRINGKTNICDLQKLRKASSQTNLTADTKGSMNPHLSHAKLS